MGYDTGLDDLWNWLIFGESSMKQDEIVRKTREMFENTGVIPHPKDSDIDPSLKPAHISVLDLVNMMIRTPRKDLPEKFQRLRGFFTEYSSRLFKDTMLASGKPVAQKEPIDDSAEALLNKHDRKAAEIAAWKGRNVEEPYDDSTEALLDKEDRKAAESRIEGSGSPMDPLLNHRISTTTTTWHHHHLTFITMCCPQCACHSATSNASCMY